MRTAGTSFNWSRVLVSFVFLLIATKTAQAQVLDPTFNAEVTTRSSHIALQPDGKILTAGFIQDLGENQMVRFNTDGTLDHSFTFGLTNTLGLFGLAALPDGKSVVAGFTSLNNNPAAVRLLNSGAVDP